MKKKVENLVQVYVLPYFQGELIKIMLENRRTNAGGRTKVQHCTVHLHLNPSVGLAKGKGRGEGERRGGEKRRGRGGGGKGRKIGGQEGKWGWCPTVDVQCICFSALARSHIFSATLPCLIYM
jgi:hypothetical protein